MFNMEVNQMQLLEIGLNALGFLAAGGMLMVLASMFRNKARKSLPVKNAGTLTATDSQIRAESGRSGRRFQFIDLSGETGDLTPPVDRSPEAAQGRRNRAEVYELAKRMLQARKPVREISDELSMPQAVSASLGCGFPSLGSRVVPLQTIAPSF